MGKNVIAVERLTKTFGTTCAVRDLSFGVQAGEIFGFLGPNGAGKTTTIRLLLDLLRPTRGQMAVFGLTLPDHSLEIRRKCGYLPGSFAAYGHMSGNDFLRFVARLRKADQTSAQSLIERLRLTERDLTRKIKHLSHGTRQKLGIVQAFMHDPELLILDEPTTGLDPLIQETFYELLRETQARGRTIFFSSHNLPEVEKVCQRVAIIREGELVALEPLDVLKKKRFRKMRLTLREPQPNLTLPDAELLEHKDSQYEFLIKGDIPELLSRLSQLAIQDIVFPEPDLEEVFLAYYRSKACD